VTTEGADRFGPEHHSIGSFRTNNPVPRSLINAAEVPNARNQPHTIETGLPQPAPIFRWSHPGAVFALIAVTITSAVSARGAANRTFRRTCVP
jgi:hypothetical protein